MHVPCCEACQTDFDGCSERSASKGELDEELRGFVEMAAEEKMKEGMSRREALRAVRLERGSLELTKGFVRFAGWESFVDTLWQDVR